ncbi:heme A synthase [bacterium]|nr:heme A synthase [bacterium]
MVALMVLVGGLTRLTESGLSIVEWAPLKGTLPPMNDAAWNEAFSAYQQSPEYIQKNHGMTLAAFKAIFWWEFIHRLIGRLIGAVFLLPLVYFAATKCISGRETLKLTAIFALGGLQGGIGWFMVKSGLVDAPMVSPVRLALHLGMAFVIFILLLRQACRYLSERPAAELSKRSALMRTRKLFAVMLGGQILLGALVAGNDAGLVYNSFPTMNGHWLPPEWLDLQPLWRNFIENHATVQWTHRMVAYLTVTALLWHSWVARNEFYQEKVRAHVILLILVVACQVVLGVSTLLYVVPVGLASLHQVTALALVAILVSYFWFVPCSSNAPSIRRKA